MGDQLDSKLVKQVLIAAAGNFLEWYDFAVFGIFSSEISSAFFLISLMLGLSLGPSDLQDSLCSASISASHK